MASLVDFYKQKLAPVGQRLSSFIDRDKSMEGTQLMQGGLGNNAKSFGKQFVQAAAQTAPTVAQDFGNMFRNTFKSVPLLSTAGNIVGDTAQRVGSSAVDVAQGAYRTLQRPDLLGKAQGVAQTIRGVGKGIVTAMPVTPFIDIAANTGKSDSLSRRLATGYSRGISQIPELAPNTQAKNINIGKISFDPAMMGAEMVGFVKNPINKKLFEATNKLIPSAEKSLKLWLATTASRGGLENILLAMPEMPEKMSTIQKAQWMATNAGIGAAQEIAGQGIVKGLSKAGGAIADSKAGKYTAEQLAKQFDNLNEFKRKATIPVSKPGFGPKLGQTITEPMWKWEMGLVDDGSMKQYNSDIDTPKLSVEPTNVKNIDTGDYGPQMTGSVETPKLQLLKGETPDQARAREVGYQIDNGVVTIKDNPSKSGGLQATIMLPGDEKPRVISNFNRQNLINEIYSILKPEYGVPFKPLSVEPVGGKVPTDKYTRWVSDRELKALQETGEIPPDRSAKVVRLNNPGMQSKGIGESKTNLVIFKDIDQLKAGKTPDGKFRDGGSAGTQTQIRGGIPKDYIESVIPKSSLSISLLGGKVEPVGGKVDLSQPTPINYSSKTIPIEKIKSVGTKGSYDPTSYEYSKKQLQSGKSVPPIEVRLENGKYIIEDGEHRFKAYKELGIKDIPVKVISPSPLGGKVEPKTVTPIRKPLKEVYLNKLNQPAELPKVPESLTTTTGLSKVSPTIQSTQRSLREPSQPLSSQDQLKSLTRVTPISSKNVASPDILPSTVKSRGLTESVQQAQNIVPEVKSGVTGTYTPKPNAQLMAEAQTLLNEGGTVDLSKVKNADQKVAATIQEAINAQQAGDHQLAANLFNNLSEQGTELGRGVQAFSLLEKMSPEAVSLSAAGQIKKYNATHSAKLPELTGDQSKLIADKVANIRTMPDGRDKNIALNEVNQIINSFIPSSLADKAITIWKAGLLTSLRTHLRNQIGNSVHTGMEIAKDVLATPIDVMLSGATGQRTKTLTVKGMGEFGSQSTRQQIMDIMSKGFDPTQQINKFDHRQVNWGNNPVEKVLKVYTDLVFRSLGAADKPYYNSALARSLYDQAGASAINAGRRGDIGFINDLVKNPTDGMLKIAINDANVATFKDKNTYSKVANAIKQSMVQAGQEYGGDFGRESSKILTEFVAPFTGVPSSIAGQIVAYSPVGLVKGIAKAGKVIVNKIPDLQRQAVEEIGRGGIGTAVMALGAYLASKGMVTGQPKDAAEQRQWDLENKPRNSIFINGKWRSLNSIGPEALVFLAGAKADEEMNNPEGSLSKYAGTLIKDQLDQSFVQGIQGPVNAITDPQRYAKSYIGNSVSSFVPNIIKDVSKSIDPYARETNTTGDYVKASIPGLRNTLVNKRDTLGRVINQEPTGAAAFVDVFNSKTPVSNPVVQEFSRLNDSGFNVAPGKIGKAQTINGQKVNLNPQELDQFEQKVGQVAMPSLQQLISSPSYQSSDDENKSKQIDSLMTKIRAQVRSGNLETVTQTVKKIVTKKVKKVSSKKPKTVKKISAPKLSKFNLASKVRKVKRIRTKQYKLQIPK